MRQDYEKLFAYLEPPEPPAGLFNRIMRQIRAERKQLIIKRWIVGFSFVGLVGSMAAFFPALNAARAGFANSGFSTFFSLLFSDSGIVMAYWQNFLLSLIESLPILSIISLLATILVFFQSLKLLVRDTRTVLTSAIRINN